MRTYTAICHRDFSITYVDPDTEERIRTEPLPPEHPGTGPLPTACQIPSRALRAMTPRTRKRVREHIRRGAIEARGGAREGSGAKPRSILGNRVPLACRVAPDTWQLLLEHRAAFEGTGSLIDLLVRERFTGKPYSPEAHAAGLGLPAGTVEHVRETIRNPPTGRLDAVSRKVES